MDSKANNTSFRFFVWILLLIATAPAKADSDGKLNRKIRIVKGKETIYQLLKEVSDQSGCLFVYDSQIINNEQVVKVSKGEYSVREAVYLITGNDKLEITAIDNHILLTLSSRKSAPTKSINQENETNKEQFFTLGGEIYDHITNEPVAFASIVVNNTSIGTISNQNGAFKMILPDSLSQHTIKIFHVGYQNQEIQAALLSGQKLRFSLEPKIIPLQEVVVRVVDPIQVLKQMIESRATNYSSKPVSLTAFYREGADYKGKNIDLTESVLKIYKTGYLSEVNTDQAKLIKMRRIISKQENDTIFPKMKSGINSCFRLDIMKDLPDFLLPNPTSSFVYTHSDINVVDNRKVNVISFVQNKNTEDPLYKGELFIDAENNALVEAHFEVNPLYIEKATEMFIQRKSPEIKLTLQRAYYTVSYKSTNNGTYCINHVRGELEFKIRKKRKLFSNTLLLWFEMVNCKTETTGVTHFPKSERLRTQGIFSETKYQSDVSFWGNFNVILPEEKLRELIINNLNQVTEPLPNDYPEKNND